METKEFALPLSQAQLVTLMKLLREKEAVIDDKSTAPRATDRKKSAWQTIAMTFNACNPDNIHGLDTS